MKTNSNIIKKNRKWIEIFIFNWSIDWSNVEQIFTEFFELYTWNDIIFDFSWISYWNSKFIWYLNKIYEYTQDKWVKLYIIWCQEPILEIFEITWILELIPYKTSIEDAIKEMTSNDEKIII